MNNKKIYILAIILSVVVIFSTFLAVIFLITNKKTVKENKIIPFSNEFIKDFSTFSYKDPVEYNNRMEKYISPSYYSDFRSRLLLREDVSSIPAPRKEKYSKYKSSQASVLSENKSRATVSIKYTSTENNPPVKPSEFETERAVIIVVKKLKEKREEKFEIVNFQFSNVSSD